MHLGCWFVFLQSMSREGSGISRKAHWWWGWSGVCSYWDPEPET